MGLPNGTCNDAILVDFAVPKQSLRFEMCKLKFQARVDFEIAPRIVRKQFEMYSKTDEKVELKNFYGKSKKECLEKRMEWSNSHEDTIVPLKKETARDYIDSLNLPSSDTYGFRFLYPYKSKVNKWRAWVRVRATMKFPAISQDSYSTLRAKLNESDGIRGNIKCFKNIFRRCAKNLIKKQQFTQFVQSRYGRVLKSLRRKWYHDSLIHEMTHPLMRIIRKLRLGSSELRDHSFYLNGGDRTCPKCQRGKETLDHYFFVCPSYKSQREIFISKCIPWVRKLNETVSVRTVLGFHEKLINPKFAQTTKHIRKKLLQETIDFISKTDRFKYV